MPKGLVVYWLCVLNCLCFSKRLQIDVVSDINSSCMFGGAGKDTKMTEIDPLQQNQ